MIKNLCVQFQVDLTWMAIFVVAQVLWVWRQPNERARFYYLFLADQEMSRPENDAKYYCKQAFITNGKIENEPSI